MALSALRARLAELIGQLQQLQRDRDTLAAAAGPAHEAVRTARAALETARASIETTTQANVDHRISVLAGAGDEPPPPSIERARQTVRECEDNLAAANEALAEIERRTETNRQAVDQRRSLVESAAASVFWTEMQPLARSQIAVVQKAQKQLVEAIAPMVALLRAAPGRDDADAQAIRRVVNEAAYLPLASWSCAQPRPPHGAEGWSTMLESLKVNPETRLPK